MPAGGSDPLTMVLMIVVDSSAVESSPPLPPFPNASRSSVVSISSPVVVSVA
jgi:hypothetical protein